MIRFMIISLFALALVGSMIANQAKSPEEKPGLETHLIKAVALMESLTVSVTEPAKGTDKCLPR